MTRHPRPAMPSDVHIRVPNSHCPDLRWTDVDLRYLVDADLVSEDKRVPVLLFTKLEPEDTRLYEEGHESWCDPSDCDCPFGDV